MADNMDNEREILNAAKNGDISSFEKIVIFYERRIFNYIYKMAGTKEDAEDLTQMTFLKLYKNLHRLDTDKSFKAWLYKIATNTTYDWLRKKRVHKELLVDDFRNLETTSTENAYNDLEIKEFKINLDSALDKIKPIYKTVLILYYREQLSYFEISEALSLPLNTIKSYLYRAKKALKDEIS